MTEVGSDSGGWLLALHSCSQGLGVGLLPWADVCTGDADSSSLQEPLPAAARLEHFATDRDLSNRILECLEAVLSARQWPQLRRLAVATGPGGFTSTRLTVVLARTLAQQGDLPLDGVSSSLLIARRLCAAASPPPSPFWLASDLPRRGRVAGLYAIDPSLPGGIAELQPPRLRDAGEPLPGAVLPADPRLPDDVGQLLAVSVARARRGAPAAWQEVVPLYPTSPVSLA